MASPSKQRLDLFHICEPALIFRQRVSVVERGGDTTHAIIVGLLAVAILILINALIT